MFVGLVRAAMISSPLSCTLSGGSQLVRVLTYSSKYRQVRRPAMVRNRRSDAERTTVGGGSGRLSHQATSGAANQIASQGDAAMSMLGRPAQISSPATSTAINGLTIIARKNPSSVSAAMRSASAAVRHSSRCLRVTNIRQSVRTMASIATAASYGSTARPSSAWARGCPAAWAASSRWVATGTSWGFRRKSSSPAKSGWRSAANTTSPPAAPATCTEPDSQPPISAATIAGATRLRRRLSKIFQ